MNLPKSIIICILLGAELFIGRASGGSVDYLNLVRSYADAMIRDGRDRYGAEFSPLFGSVISRQSHEVTQSARLPNGVRRVDRDLGGSNPMNDQRLYQALYRLTDITGQPTYRHHADAALDWFFRYTQSPATGLLAWGEHLHWDFFTEYADTYRHPLIHEYVGRWDLWDRVYQLAPDQGLGFAMGLWQHQIADQSTGSFSRHALYDRHGPASGAEYPRHGSYYIHTWAQALAHSDDPTFQRDMIDAIESVAGGFSQRAKQTESGTLPASSTYLLKYWPGNNIEFAINTWKAADLLEAKGYGAPVGMLRALATIVDTTWLRTPHDLSPGGHGFLNGGSTATLDVAGPATEATYSDMWDLSYGSHTHAGHALFALERYDQIGLEDYLQLALLTGDLYLRSDPEPTFDIWPKSMADSIALMLKLHDLTSDPRYVDRADQLGQLAAQMFFDDTSALPFATSKITDHYESLTGGPDLAWRLLQLHQATSITSDPLSAVTIVAVPEPSTLAFVLLGLLPLIPLGRRVCRPRTGAIEPSCRIL